MTGYLFEYASAAKSPARMSRLLLHLLVRFSVPKQLFAPSKTIADSPTDIDGVFAFKRQNVAKERFYSVVHLPAPPPAGLACAFFHCGNFAMFAAIRRASSLVSSLAADSPGSLS
jgi:hypothetical protein